METPRISSQKKFKSQPSAGELMLTVYWDAQLQRYLKEGSTVNTVSYTAVQRTNVSNLIQTPRPIVEAHTVQTLEKLRFEVLEHPAYSPDLATSDYYLLDPRNVNMP